MRVGPAPAPVPHVRRIRRALAGTVLAAAVLLVALAGWQSGPRAASGLLAASAAQLVAAQNATQNSTQDSTQDSITQPAPGHDDRWQSGARPEGVLAWSRDRLVHTSHLPDDRGAVRAGWALALLLLAAGTAAARTGRAREALVGVSPSRGPPATA